MKTVMTPQEIAIKALVAEHAKPPPSLTKEKRREVWKGLFQIGVGAENLDLGYDDRGKATLNRFVTEAFPSVTASPELDHALLLMGLHILTAGIAGGSSRSPPLDEIRKVALCEIGKAILPPDTPEDDDEPEEDEDDDDA